MIRAGRTHIRPDAFAGVFIVAVIWTANFLHCRSFGFYEDDWYYFAPAYQHTFMSWFGLLRQELMRFDLGRPLQDTSLRVFGYIGSVLSSISVLYLFAFVLLSSSAFLFYRVLRVRFPVAFSTLAVLIFVLTPLTTIKQYLNLAFTFGPGLICLFLALLLFSRGHKLLSMILAVAALFTYEPIFLLYFAAPLVRRGKFTRMRRRQVIMHAAIGILILAVYTLLRESLRETRVASMSAGPLQAILLSLRYCVMYALSSLLCYVYAAYVGVREAGWEAVFYCLLFFIPILTVALRFRPSKSGSLNAARRKRWLFVAAAGLLLTALGYGFAYFQVSLDRMTVFPLTGRDTRVSAAASIGSSILIAAILSLIGELRARAAHGITTVFLSLLFLYSFVVQRDYVNQWIHQREFLTQAMLLTPDVQRDTQFIVRTNWIDAPLFPHGVRRPSIGFSRHGLQVSLQTLFGWTAGPKIFFVYADQWNRYLALHPDRKLYWIQEIFPGGWARSTTDPIAPGRVITMTEDSRGLLTRTETPIWVGGQQIVQMPPDAARPESNWPFLARSELLAKIVPNFALTSVISQVSWTPATPVLRIEGGLSLAAVASAGEGATIEKGPPLKVVTAPNSGYFAAALPVQHPPDVFGARYAYLRARVLQGRIGIAVVDNKTRMLAQKTIDPAAAPADLFLPIIDRAANLVIYNAETKGMRSEILIEDGALVISGETRRQQ